jgi:hypothetical protein
MTNSLIAAGESEEVFLRGDARDLRRLRARISPRHNVH